MKLPPATVAKSSSCPSPGASPAADLDGPSTGVPGGQLHRRPRRGRPEGRPRPERPPVRSDRPGVLRKVGHGPRPRPRTREMPPKSADQPEPAARRLFLQGLSDSLESADRDRAWTAGRAVRRRLNRYEYENTLRDLLRRPLAATPRHAPRGRRGTLGSTSPLRAADVSHVQMARYLGAAEYALREATAATEPSAPGIDDEAVLRPGAAGNLGVPADEIRPVPAGARSGRRSRCSTPGSSRASSTRRPPRRSGALADPATREQEAFGVVASSYEPIEPKFTPLPARPMAGQRSRLRFSPIIRSGPGRARGPEVVDTRPDRRFRRGGRPSRWSCGRNSLPGRRGTLGRFDVNPEPGVYEVGRSGC